MSNYVQNTNFATKDALPSGDSLKIVRGTEINIEFNNIATAIATKADTNSPTFTGTVVIPTLQLTNDLAISDGGTGASTAAGAATNLAAAFGNLLFPVGSIYINAGVTTNPATLLGFGTWVAFGAGRVMVGLNGADPLFDTLEETGGSKDATLPSHNHTATSTVTDPGHRHRLRGQVGGAVKILGAESGVVAGIGGGSSGSFVDSGPGGIIMEDKTTGVTVSTSIANNGSSPTNANLQPYITVAMWKRTA